MPLSATEGANFNFDTNETLTLQKIIRATFANPDRRKFAQCKLGGNTIDFWPDNNIDPEALIQKITTDIPIALQRFNEEKIQLYDTSKLDSEVDMVHTT